MTPTIQTQRLILRPFALADAVNYHRLILADEQTMRWLPIGKPVPRARTESIIKGILDQWQDHGYGLWAVIDQESDKLIGHCGLQPLDNTHEIELTCAIAKAYRRNGLATEAGRACIRYAFETQNLQRIVAVCPPENQPAQRLIAKLGLKAEKKAHVYDSYLPLYAIARGDFKPDESAYSLH